MDRRPNLEKLDKNKPVIAEEVADEADLERAMRHYGNWLKERKDKIIFIDRAIVSERRYKIVVLFQLKDDAPEPPNPTF